MYDFFISASFVLYSIVCQKPQHTKLFCKFKAVNLISLSRRANLQIVERAAVLPHLILLRTVPHNTLTHIIQHTAVNSTCNLNTIPLPPA